MYTAIYNLGSKYARNILILSSKWLSNSKTLYFSESVELSFFANIYLLLNYFFKTVGTVLNGVFQKA